MSIANFFNKIALGASQVLHNYDRENFENILLSHRVKIFFDDNAASTSEGRAALDLLVRLLARIYPNLQIQGSAKDFADELKQLARSINPEINLNERGKATITLVVGKTVPSNDLPVFYLGSDEWVCRFSDTAPVGSSDSNNPFGAGAAACMGAANVFRFVFNDQLPHSITDKEFALSLLDGSLSEENSLKIDKLNLGEVNLVGVGAIGNGFCWALKQIKDVSGKLILIDHETITLTNLQRYVLTDQNSVKRPKVELIAELLGTRQLEVFYDHPMNWKEYIQFRGNHQMENVFVCVDNAEDRIIVQGALPKKIFNAWTQKENLGISRHLDFNNAPCLCCLYLPTEEKISRSQEIANNLNIPANEPLIRKYLASHLPFDQPLMQLINSANNIRTDKLRQFIGQPLDIFYSEVVCGGILMQLGAVNNAKYQQQVEVPSAFESAFAGILLCAELIKDKLNYPISDPSKSTRFNLIRPITSYLKFTEEKASRCICTDQIYKEVYKVKWQ